mmetsp:Transcript_28626/g.46061  ORF Transcript_28626/g.46061 Transcript_28626/m.46061 type:complete len:116 (+) Transcript_28626:54-401(+)
MLPALRAVRHAGSAVVRQRAPAMASQMRCATGIKIMEDKGKALESHYWAQEDERLLKKMIENNPELDPAFQGINNILDSEGSSTADQVKLIFMKHGIPPMNKALVADIVALVEKS